MSGDGQSEKLGQPLTGAATQSVGLTTSERQQLTTTKSEPDEHPDDRALRVHKDYALFWIAVLVILGTLGCAVYGVATVQSLDDKRWLQSLITAILGGLVGYAVRK